MNYRQAPDFTILLVDCPKCDGRGEYTSDEGDFRVECEQRDGSGSVPDDRENEFEPEDND